jgi:hypothetical protein
MLGICNSKQLPPFVEDSDLQEEQRFLGIRDLIVAAHSI